MGTIVKAVKPKEAVQYGDGYQDVYPALMVNYFGKSFGIEYGIKSRFNSYTGTEKSKEPVVLPNELPSFSAFARLLNVTGSKIEEWRVSHEEFSTAYDMCKDIQMEIIVNGGLSGAYNAQFCKYLLESMFSAKGMGLQGSEDVVYKMSKELQEECL